MSHLFSEFTQLPRAFFIDVNAFYTSVEQQECPAYRGKPTIVVPLLTENTCAIAASYEAKALGIKTGTVAKYLFDPEVALTIDNALVDQ